MPPVLGPASPSRRRLKSCAGLRGSTWSPSLRKKSDTSGPDRNSSTRIGPLGQVGVGVGERGLAVLRHDDALAGGEAVGLDDVRSAQLVERRLDLGARAGAQRAAGRNPGGLHDPLREGLRALELGGGLAGAEHRDAVLAQQIGDARDEGSLRADHHEVDGRGLRVLRDGGGVVRIERDDRRRPARCRRCRGPRRSRADAPPSGGRG